MIIGAAQAGADGSSKPVGHRPQRSATCTRASWTKRTVERAVCTPTRGPGRRRRRGSPRRAGRGAWARCSAPAWAAAPSGTSTPTPRTRPRYLVHLAQAGLGLPDESYYRDEQYAEILRSLPRHVARCCAGRTRRSRPTAARASSRWRPSSRRALGHRQAPRRQPDLQPDTFAELRPLAPGFDWAAWVTALGGSPSSARRAGRARAAFSAAFAALLVRRAARGLAGVAALASDACPRAPC